MTLHTITLFSSTPVTFMRNVHVHHYIIIHNSFALNNTHQSLYVKIDGFDFYNYYIIYLSCLYCLSISGLSLPAFAHRKIIVLLFK